MRCIRNTAILAAEEIWAAGSEDIILFLVLTSHLKMITFFQAILGSEEREEEPKKEQSIVLTEDFGQI